MSDFSGLNTAVSGLFAHRQRIDIIGQNIANAETPGYKRQVTNLSAVDGSHPGLFSGSGQTSGGVEATITRRWNQLLDMTAKQESSRSSSLATQASALGALEAEIGSLSGDGLGASLQRLWDSFGDLANDPSDLAVRSVVLSDASAVADHLRADVSAIDSLRESSVIGAQSAIDRINVLSKSIADLDSHIVAGVASGSPPNGLLDRRDSLITELSGLVALQIAHKPNGQVRLSVDGHNLVADGYANAVQLVRPADGDLSPLGYERVAIASESGRVLQVTGGSLQGSMISANESIPRQRRALDAVAASVVSTVNDLHGAGTGLDGSTGLNFFEPTGTTAGAISVSTDVLGRPERIAASGAGLLDNGVALAIAGLGTDPAGPSVLHGKMLSELGGRVRDLSTRSDAAQLASNRANQNQQAADGVNLDEELADLVSAQRAYEASARLISTIDGMLDVLINRTGLVGR